jgi:hypothetical protein
MSTSSIQDYSSLSHLVAPSNLSISASSSSSNDQGNSAVLRTEEVASSSLASSVSVSASSASSAPPIVSNKDEMQITQEELNQWIAKNPKIEYLVRKILNLLISNESQSHSVDNRRQERIQMEQTDLLTQENLQGLFMKKIYTV